MKKGVRFNWTAECQQAFDTLKLRLMTEPILALPNDEGTYVVDTDASAFGLGAVTRAVRHRKSTFLIITIIIIIDKQVAEMEKHGIIEPTVSSWASNVVLVRKKDGSLRFCIDY